MTAADALTGVLVGGWACWQLATWCRSRAIAAAPAARLGRPLSGKRWARFVRDQSSPDVRRWLRWTDFLRWCAEQEPLT